MLSTLAFSRQTVAFSRQTDTDSAIIIIVIIQFIKCLRPWLQRHWRQVSGGCYSKALRKKYVLSLDLKTDSESALIIVSGNEFQTVGAEQRKARLAKSVLVNRSQ